VLDHTTLAAHGTAMIYTHSAAYAALAITKVWQNSNFAPIGTECTYDELPYLYTYKKSG